MIAAERESGKGERRERVKALLLKNAQILSVLAMLGILIVVFSVTTDAFFTTGNALNILRQYAPTLILAVAMTFVITSSGIDLSVGSLVALTGALSASMLAFGNPTWLTIIAMLGLGIGAGVIHGWFTAYQGIPALIVTLAGLTAWRGVAQLLTQGYSISIDSSKLFVVLGQGQVGPIPVPAIIAAVVVLVGWVLMNRTKYGQYITGIGSNEEAVRRAGVNTRLVKLSAFMLTGAAAALGGMIFAARLTSGSANAAVALELEVIAAVVLGGTSIFGGRGTVIGAVLGALTIAVISNGLILMRVSPFAVPVAQGVVLLLAIWANTKIFSRLGR
ncbi:ABC transporter permease [Rubrobacter aplysinae]|uniref:ABC transporter permease n=1 Tax=Rubrobacter aplysinae TaxID=909625 RepID=UPI00064B9AFE|nr:ABC transporter permease [Rubrobacter aplysinae]